MRTKAIAGLVCGLMLILGLAQLINGQQAYSVGDVKGWRPYVDYKAWAAGIKFYKDDILEFRASISVLNVQEVTAKDFANCYGGNPIHEYRSGINVVFLNSTGNHYFICGLYDYCHTGGMKVNITVNERQ